MAVTPSRRADGPPAFTGCLRAFKAEFDYVYRSLRRHGVPPTDAEDLTQEVFLVMWRRWSEYDPGRPLRPWLAGIAYRVAHDHRKRSWREVLTGGLDTEDAAPTPDESLLATRAHRLVLEVLDRLPEQHRAVLVTHDIDGLPAQEIATLLSMPLATAYTRIRRARIAFAQEVRRREADAPEALLELERSRVPPAPAEARRRGIARVSAIAFLPSAPRMPGSAPSPRAPTTTKVTTKLTTTLAPWAIEAGALVLAFVVSSETRTEARSAVASTGPRAAHVTAPALQVVGESPSDPGAIWTGPAHAPATSPGPARVAPAPTPPGLARDLVGYWSFDEASGSAVARDQSRLGNDCVLRDRDPQRAWTAGVQGGAVDLGDVGWLECAQPELPSGAPPALSIAVWAKRTQFSRGRNIALVSREMGPAGASDDYYFVGFDGFKVKATGRAWPGATASSVPGTVDRWVHVAFTHAADGATRLYVDGVEVARNQLTHKRVLGGLEPLMIGAGYTSHDRQVRQHFGGLIDELALYQRVLSEDEVAALAAGARPSGTLAADGEVEQ